MRNDGLFWTLAFGAALLITVASGGAGWPVIVLMIVARIICQPFYKTVNYAEDTIGYQEGCTGRLVGCGATLLIVALFVLAAMVAVMGEHDAGLFIKELTKGLEQ